MTYSLNIIYHGYTTHGAEPTYSQTMSRAIKIDATSATANLILFNFNRSVLTMTGLLH